MLNYTYNIVFFYKSRFNNHANISSILFKFFSYEFFANINYKKI